MATETVRQIIARKKEHADGIFIGLMAGQVAADAKRGSLSRGEKVVESSFDFGQFGDVSLGHGSKVSHRLPLVLIAGIEPDGKVGIEEMQNQP